MKIELPIDLAQELPQSVVPTLEKELLNGSRISSLSAAWSYAVQAPIS
ncbi:hypothetical protein SPM00_15495 [Enterobacter hormaechei subsp. xiangfangensis]